MSLKGFTTAYEFAQDPPSAECCPHFRGMIGGEEFKDWGICVAKIEEGAHIGKTWVRDKCLTNGLCPYQSKEVK